MFWDSKHPFFIKGSIMDDDTKLHALETRLVCINDLRDFLSRCNAECGNNYQRSKRKHLMLAILEKFNKLTVPHGFKKQIQVMKNEVQSVYEGLLQDIDESELQLSFDSYIHECDESIEKVKKQIQNLKASIDEYEENQEHHFESMLSKTKNEISDLSKIGDQEVFVAKAPIIPIADDSYLNFGKLAKSFDCDELSGYVVLHSQLVIGINKNVKNMEKTLSDTIKKLENQNATKYILLMNRGVSYSNVKNALWFWIMNEHDANNLRLAFTNFKHKSMVRTISIRDWGFANAS